MMVKVWLYGYSKGIRSSRRVEKALHEDVAFRIMAGNQQPDHWTLNDFRRRHHEALGDLFRQTVQMARACGLVKMGHVAVNADCENRGFSTLFIDIWYTVWYYNIIYI